MLISNSPKAATILLFMEKELHRYGFKALKFHNKLRLSRCTYTIPKVLLSEGWKVRIRDGKIVLCVAVSLEDERGRTRNQ